MSEWTMMPPGAVLRLIINVPDAFDPPKTEMMYLLTINPPPVADGAATAPPLTGGHRKIRMTPTRQAVADAFDSNGYEPMTVADIQNIARVSPAVVRTMIAKGILIPAGDRRGVWHTPESVKYFDTGTVKLNTEQQSAADAISGMCPPACGGSVVSASQATTDDEGGTVSPRKRGECRRIVGDEGGDHTPNFAYGINRCTESAKSFSKTLRQNMTLYECLLWKSLRKSPSGFAFRKQHPIGKYIVDFINLEHKLIIELDGDGHLEDKQIRHDAVRDKFLTDSGYRIIRFWNSQVYKNMQNVLDIIYYLLTHDDMPELREFYPKEIISPPSPPSAVLPPQAGGDIAPHFHVFLLDGITGSGKTQVYFDAALRAYMAGRSVLLMMPEIALTAQFMNRFTARFGAPPVIWHSNLTAAKRRDIWRGVASGEIRMVVGTRSALFLPWQNLGLIVVDEEHDGSYKQEDMGNYHARDMAILRAKIADFPVILASATPSAETLRNAMSGKYTHLHLTSRFGGATLPRIETIDMRVERPENY